MKKFYIFLTAFFLFFSSCIKTSNQDFLAINSVPIDAVAIIEFQDFNEALIHFHSSLFNQLDTIPIIKQCLNTLIEISKLNPNSKNLLTSIHKSGAESYSTLFVLPKINLLDINNTAQNNFDISPPIKTYNDIEINTITINNEILFVAYGKKVILMSQSQLLLESAIRQLKSNINLNSNIAFNKIYKSTNKKEVANIYLNYSQTNEFINWKLPGLSNNSLSNLTDWSGLDFNLTHEYLLLNGISTSKDSLGEYLGLFYKNSPQKISLANFSPKNTSLLIGIGIENYQQFHRKYKQQFLKKNKKLNTYQKKIKEHEIDVENVLTSWIDNQLGVFYSNCSDLNLKECKGAIIKSRDVALAQKELNTISDTSYSEIFRGINIQRLNCNSLFSTIYGELFNNTHNPYYTNFEEYFVFTSNLALLKTTINDIINKSTLNTKKEFKYTYNTLSEKSNVFTYASNPQLISLMQVFGDNNLNTSLSKYTPHLQNLNGVAAQYIADSQPIHTNYLITYNQQTTEKTNLLWSYNLDSSLSSNVFIVKNHYNKQNEILVQDDKNTLYLLNAKGELLWKRQCNEKIKSKVFQIDAFKNNKLQLLFNTNNYIYLIDRNGKNVDNFPIKLKNKSTTPLSLFDYDNNRNYRILIACGKNILNYNKEGKIVEGWNFTKANSNISRPIQLFQVMGKDFILVYEDDGTINLLNRKGEIRIPVKQKLQFSENLFTLKKGNSLATSSITNTKHDGSLVNILFNGEIDIIINSDKIDASHIYKLKDGYEMMLNYNSFKVKGKAMFIHDFENKIEDINMFSFNQSPYFTAFSKEKNEVFTLDENGNIMEDFPLYSTIKPAMGYLDNKEKFHLIIGSKDGTVYNYLLK